MPASPDSPYFELRRSAIQGRGAFATQDIAPGTRIIEYTGERISQAEADRRYDDASMKRHHTFLFALDSGKVIDADTPLGNEARFINHSCDPNCEAVETRGRIFIESLRAIRKGEELVYDYAYERTSATTPEDEAMYECRCGSPKCRGSILAPLKPKPKRAAASKKKVAKKGTKTKTKAGAKTKAKTKTKASSKKSGTKTKKKSARR